MQSQFNIQRQGGTANVIAKGRPNPLYWAKGIVFGQFNGLATGIVNFISKDIADKVAYW